MNDLHENLVGGAGGGRQPEVLTVSTAVQRAKQADESGWDWLFDRFYPVVCRYATARLGERDAAEDVAQEVFVAAVRMIGQLRSHEEPVVEAWFLKIARYKIVDRYRRQAREPELPGAGARQMGASPAGEDPSQTAIDRISTSQLQALLAALTDDQRDVLARRFVLDQSLDQVATNTGRRTGTVKALQHRGLAALQRRLREERDD